MWSLELLEWYEFFFLSYLFVKGNKMPATILTSIAMKEEDLDIIRILHSERKILEVMVQSEILGLDRQQEIQLDSEFCFYTFNLSEKPLFVKWQYMWREFYF